jgi:hypothetical protein
MEVPLAAPTALSLVPARLKRPMELPYSCHWMFFVQVKSLVGYKLIWQTSPRAIGLQVLILLVVRNKAERRVAALG